MEDKSIQGIAWTVITLISGVAVAMSQRPVSKLIASLFAIGAGTKAVDCFWSSAEVAYQKLTVSKGYHQLQSTYRE